jgi:hypothetical protein
VAFGDGDTKPGQTTFLTGATKRFVSDLAGNYPLFGSIFDDSVIRPLTSRRRFGDDPLILERAGQLLLAGTELAEYIAGGTAKKTDQKEALATLGSFAADVSAMIGAPGPGTEDIAKRLSSGQLFPGLSPAQKKPKR